MVIARVILFGTLLFSQLSYSQNNWKISLGISTGGAYNFPSKLVIHQEGLPDISMKAKFDTEAFVLPWYWDINGSVQRNEWIYGMHFNHHKLVLTNPTSDIQNFEISHGFNMVNGFIGKRFKDFYSSLGIGVSFSHPEGVVRGRWIANQKGIPLLSGFYDLSGPNFEASIGKKWAFSKCFEAYAECRTTFSTGNIKTHDGSIDLTTGSIHLNVGLIYFLDLEGKSAD